MFSSILAIVLSVSLVSAQTCSRSYTVKEGDYCDLISAANNASTYQLAVSNYQTINDGCTNLEVGQSICLGTSQADCKQTYVVQDGDYCDLIAGNFGTNFTTLRSNNPQIDDNCYNLYVGEVLCVATSVIVAPAPSGWALPGSSLDDGNVYWPPASSTSVAVSSTSAGVTVSSTTSTTPTPFPVTVPNNAVNATTDDNEDDDCTDEPADADAGEEDDGGADDDIDDCTD